MDKVLSVDDFIGGLLKQGGGNGSWKMGLGRRTDSEAAFQEFLKRIPSATALSSQVGEEGKPMFASGSNASLFGFGSSNLECGGVPRVASLDMLRNMVDQDEKNRTVKPSEAAVQFTGAPEQPAQSPTSLRQQPGANAQLFQPSNAAMSHPSQSLAQSASLQASAMPSLPVGSAAAMGGMLQVPGTLLAYQNLPHSPQLLPVQGVQHSMQAAPTSVKGPSSQSDAGGMPGASEEHDKMEQRRARRMLSNRESARRSRKRKQEQLSELETQVKLLEEKNENLESQCQAAAVHVQSILADKSRLENENQHLMSILQQLQKSLGEDTIRKHLPAALGGAGPIPGATRPEGTEAAAADGEAAGAAQDGPAGAAPLPIKLEANASEAANEGARELAVGGEKRSLDAAGSPDGAAVKTPRTRRDSDPHRQNGTH